MFSYIIKTNNVAILDFTLRNAVLSASTIYAALFNSLKILHGNSLNGITFAFH